MAGRTENPLPLEPTKLRELAARLREIRADAGNPVYRSMAETGLMTASALSQAASGVKYPTWECVRAYLKGCGVDNLTISTVRELWEAADAEKKDLRKSRKNPPSNGQDGSTAAVPPLALELSIPEHLLLSQASQDLRPRRLTDFKELAQVLFKIMEDAGLTRSEVVKKSKERAVNDPDVTELKKSTVYDVLKTDVKEYKARANEAFTREFLEVCGLPADQVRAWMTYYRMLRHQDQVAKQALKALQTGVFDADTVELNMALLTGAVPYSETDDDETGSDSAVPAREITTEVEKTADPIPAQRPAPAPAADNEWRALTVSANRPVSPAGPSAHAETNSRAPNSRRIVRHRKPALLIIRRTYRIEISEEMVMIALMIIAVLTMGLVVFLK